MIHTDTLIQQIEDKYRSFFESIEQGYYETDQMGNFIFFNDFICNITGYAEDELMKMNFKDLADRADARKISGIFKEIYVTGKPKIGVVFDIRRKDGIKRQMGSSICLIKDPNNRKKGFRGIARDISDRKLMERQLKQAQKLEAIGKLAAGVAHEINSPIQYISDNIRFLRESFSTINNLMEKYHLIYKAVLSGKDIDKIAREIAMKRDESDLDYMNTEIPRAISQSLEGLNHVSKILSAMKTFSHPGTGEKKCMDINAAIQNSITITKNEWKYVAEMVTDFDESIPLVPFEEDEFHQVILNFIVNASHAIKDVVGNGSNRKGEIRIRTFYKVPWVEVHISDTGTGIAEDIKNKIFDPFFTTKEVGQGTGQGLAIAYNIIVSRHGGIIECDTEKDKGTTMLIKIPLEIPNPINGERLDERKNIVC